MGLITRERSQAVGGGGVDEPREGLGRDPRD